jgi:hypothetical protein
MPLVGSPGGHAGASIRPTAQADAELVSRCLWAAGAASQFHGSEGARQLVLDDRHQAIVGRCAHTMGVGTS